MNPIDQLTDDEISVEVAKLCGCPKFFIRKPMHDPFGYYREGGRGYTSSKADAWKVTEEVGRHYTLYEDSKPGDAAYRERVILEPAPPANYPSDLNACAEFEKTLSVGEDELYRVQLGRLVLGMGPDDYLHWSDLGSISGLVSASARQRCIAFLKVKGVL